MERNENPGGGAEEADAAEITVVGKVALRKEYEERFRQIENNLVKKRARIEKMHRRFEGGIGNQRQDNS